MTYLQLVNAVLVRLRESTVASVSTTAQSLRVGKFINDAKREVEDAWEWDALLTTLTLATSTSVSSYTLTGSGLKPKGISVNNTTSKYPIHNASIKWILDQRQLTTVQAGPPSHYAWRGNDGTDSKIEIFPTPNGVYSLNFNLYVPQADLSADGDVISIPYRAVEAGAYARAIVERGEDGGMASSEAYALAKNIMADEIALEASRFIERSVWVPV